MARLEKRFEDGIILRRFVRNGGHQILQDVSRQRKFGENNQICILRFGFGNQAQVFVQICLDIPQGSVDLGKGKVEFHCI